MSAKHIIVPTLALTSLIWAGQSSAQRRPKQIQDDRQDIAAIVGDYDVTFEKIADNCKSDGMKLRRSAVSLHHDAALGLRLSISNAPVMFGKSPRRGRFRVKTELVSSHIVGSHGKYSASGRSTGGRLQFVYIAEYFTAKHKPLCTQSWNATGPKRR